jgi:hypothetical protein
VARVNFVFSETSPSAAGTAASSQPVQNAGNFLAPGVAGPLQNFDAADIFAELTGATGGTLDVYLQRSPDDGVTWYDAVHFTQLASGGSAVIYSTALSNAQQTAAPVAVGKNLSPALGAGVTVNGPTSDRLRLVMVAGSGTSAGAAVTVRVMAQRAEIESRP